MNFSGQVLLVPTGDTHWQRIDFKPLQPGQRQAARQFHPRRNLRLSVHGLGQSLHQARSARSSASKPTLAATGQLSAAPVRAPPAGGCHVRHLARHCGKPVVETPDGRGRPALPDCLLQNHKERPLCDTLSRLLCLQSRSAPRSPLPRRRPPTSSSARSAPSQAADTDRHPPARRRPALFRRHQRRRRHPQQQDPAGQQGRRLQKAAETVRQTRSAGRRAAAGPCSAWSAPATCRRCSGKDSRKSRHPAGLPAHRASTVDSSRGSS